MSINTDVITLTELIGRTITKASAWADRSSMSIVLDNGGILQISATHDPSNLTDLEPVLRWEVEFDAYDKYVKDLFKKANKMPFDKAIVELRKAINAHPHIVSRKEFGEWSIKNLADLSKVVTDRGETLP